jgi:hypothetical protein
MSSAYGLMPIIPSTIVISSTAASAPVTGIVRGVMYRVIATAAVNLQFTAAAAANTGLYLAPNVEYYFKFGMSDSQGTNLVLNVIGTATVYFTPVVSVN